MIDIATQRTYMQSNAIQCNTHYFLSLSPVTRSITSGLTVSSFHHHDYQPHSLPYLFKKLIEDFSHTQLPVQRIHDEHVTHQRILIVVVGHASSVSI